MALSLLTRRAANASTARAIVASSSGGRRSYFTDNLGCRIGSAVDAGDEGYKDNASRMQTLVDKLRGRVDRIVQGGGEKAIARHTSRGKLVPRDRILQLIDPGSPFLELSPLAGYRLYGEEEVPAGGIITGIGRVRG